MPTIFSTSPHFDDYDETKQFVRILFRPGRAVQARELTQLQTIIQGQVERFGKGIYKDGSFITPPETVLDRNFSFVKLQNSVDGVEANNVIEDLVGNIVTGETSAVKALVINHSKSTSDDPPTIFVKYLVGGTNKQETFSDDEKISFSTNSVKSLASSSTGFGTSFNIGKSVVFLSLIHI